MPVMKSKVKVFILTLSLLFSVGSIAQVPDYSCAANTEFFPLVGAISVKNDIVTLERRDSIDDDFSIISFRGAREQLRRTYAWRGPLKQELVIKIKPTPYIGGYSGTYVYFKDGVETFVSFTCQLANDEPNPTSKRIHHE
jgi:hypothetical protein